MIPPRLMLLLLPSFASVVLLALLVSLDDSSVSLWELISTAFADAVVAAFSSSSPFVATPCSSRNDMASVVARLILSNLSRGGGRFRVVVSRVHFECFVVRGVRRDFLNFQYESNEPSNRKTRDDVKGIETFRSRERRRGLAFAIVP